MNRWATIAALLAALALVPLGTAQADDGADGGKVRTPGQASSEQESREKQWYERLTRELTDLERRIAALDGANIKGTEAGREAVRKNLARALLDLTNRVFDLKKRVRKLEHGAAVAGESSGAGASEKDAPPTPAANAVAAKEDDPRVASKGSGKQGDGKSGRKGTRTGRRPSYLRDRALVDKIPSPRKSSRVRFVSEGGIRKGRVGLSGLESSGPLGRLPGEIQGSAFLVMDTPVIGLELTIVNFRGFLFQEEEFVYVNVDGRVIESAMKWRGKAVPLDEEKTMYVEKMIFTVGLTDFIAMLTGGHVTITIGLCTFELARPCVTVLEDLCSCFHPDRVDQLR